jgi:prepilin-type processing-associated H-X9-DG protein
LPVTFLRAIKNTGEGMMDRAEYQNGFNRIGCLVVFIIILLGYFFLRQSLVPNREQSRRAKCFSNLKQIGLSLKQYALDNNDTLPWADDIEPYQALGKLHPSYAWALEVFRCPSSSDAKWDIGNAHINNIDGTPFAEDACKKSLSYAYSFNKDGNGKEGIKGPWSESAPSSLRLAADKYTTHDYSTDSNSKTQPSNHPIKRVWWKYKGGRNVGFLDGSAKWEDSLAPLDVDPAVEYEKSGHSESDQTGADWWSDPPPENSE